MTHIVTRSSDALQDGIESDFDFILMDGSGSMSDKWWPMLQAIDQYISELKGQQVSTHITLHVFDDTNIALEQRNVGIAQWKTFAEEPIGAHFGTTPLYDAIVMMGRNIQKLNPDPSKGRRILIVTDGQDTGNLFADLNMAKNILDWLRNQGFQITFMGCDFNNSTQAKALGATPENSIGVRKEKLDEALKLLGQRAARHSRTGQDIHFSEDERKTFGGYLGYSGG